MKTRTKNEGLKTPQIKPRKRDATNKHFDEVDLAGKFKIILRQKDAGNARKLFYKLAHEERLAFFRTHYKGVKVAYLQQERQALRLAPVRLVRIGCSLIVMPVINGVSYMQKLADFGDNLTPEECLRYIQKHLPTVKTI